MLKDKFLLSDYLLEESHVFKDAIHNYIQVEHLIFWQLINTKEMQRLRRIKQLGGTFMVYQCAEHSRFTHSLGVYEIARRMIDETPLKHYLNDYDKMTVLCAALLHDLGHGPYSHSFEEVFHTNHENITVQIILGDTKVHQVLSCYHPDLAKDVASVIEKTHPNKILIQMISSQLDADRMDYLLRDSYFAGTTYGKFDLYRILRTLRVVDDKIVFKFSGVQAIENYILARYHMYWQVYYHPTARCYEQILLNIFKRLDDLYKSNYSFQTDLRFLYPFLKGNWDYHDYLMLDESIIQYYFRCFTLEEDKILSDLASRFLNRNLFWYEDYLGKEQLQTLLDAATSHGFDTRYYILTDNQQQIPYTSYGTQGMSGDIQILMDDGSIKDFPDVSEIVYPIVMNKKNKVDHKIYFPMEIRK